MKARGYASFALLFSIAAGCFGPAPAPSASSPRYEPYTHIFAANVTNVEAREPTCNPGCTEYYLVRIVGSENATRIRGPDVLRPCRQAWLFDLTQGNKSVVYNASRYPSFDPSTLNTLVAENFWGVSFSDTKGLHGCPTLYGLHTYPKNPPPVHKRIIGSYGLAEIHVFRDGFLTLGTGAYARIGQKLVVSYGRLHAVGNTTYFVQGGFELSNLGPWPIANLDPGSGTIKGQG